MEMKKGIAVTAAMLLLAGALLYLALVVSNYNTSLRQAAISIGEMDEAYSQMEATAHGFRQLELSQGVNVSVRGGNVTLAQNTSRLLEYSENVQRWAEFAAAFSDANVSIVLGDAKRPRVYLEPIGVEVDNAPSRVGYTPQNVQNVSGYDISIWVREQAPIINWSSISTLPPADPNAMYFHIGVQGTNGVVSDTKYLAKNGSSELRLQNASGSPIIVVQASPPAALKVFYTRGIYIKTVLLSNASGGIVAHVSGCEVSATRESAKAAGGVIVGES